MRNELPQVVVYSRPGCHLCEVLVEELLPLLRDRAVLDVRNIEDRDDWVQTYGLLIPLVEINGQPVCKYQLDQRAVLEALDADSAAISTS